MDQPNIFDAAVAVIGMAGRFPGASNLDEFWSNVSKGVESISFFTEQELLEAGVSPELLRNPKYVKAAALLKDFDYFDANFFDIRPSEAIIMDPQHRVFLECAWEAMENAGYAPERFKGAVGVYAGSNATDHLSRIRSSPELRELLGDYHSYLSNDKDFLSTRVSYKLNLTGPSLAIQTACSTSLVAVHVACQSLLNGECEMALAGGVGIAAWGPSGYLYQEGGIHSPDGRCQPFDIKARGTVSGSGAGVVVLKKFRSAVADGDYIHAIIRGSAINNDGHQKAGYTAPSVEGQAKSLAEALAVTDVSPDTVSYVEAHGTGTPLGDPVEVAALTHVFRSGTRRKQFCALASTKANIGHLNAAAGIAGLIRTVLALQFKALPASPYFEQPNPKIALNESPFYITSKSLPWPDTGVARRAIVSSLGIGGTNAHVIVEEAPSRGPSGPSRQWQLLTLSARTPVALQSLTGTMACYLEKAEASDLPDIAYTLQLGRTAFEHRRTIVCRERADALAALSEPDSKFILNGSPLVETPSIAFLFPGVGSQYVNMAVKLYNRERLFRADVDRCFELLRPLVPFDLRSILFPTSEHLAQSEEMIDLASIAHPAIFIIEYCLAQFWMKLGLRPAALFGHSLGEYAAATIAGVFSLDDALKVVTARGRLMASMPRGTMLAVPLSEQQVVPLLGDTVSLASINSPNSCVISGPTPAVQEIEEGLRRMSVVSRRLRFSHACHSGMLDPILSEFTREVEKVRLGQPQIPFISSLTGTWIGKDEAKNPTYWGKQLRATVRFADGIRQVLQEHNRVCIETGPGRGLGGLVKRQGPDFASRLIVTTLCPGEDEIELLCRGLGQCWVQGAAVDWDSYYADEKRCRIPLPTYPFERQRYWVNARSCSAQHAPREQQTPFSATDAAVPLPGKETEKMEVPLAATVQTTGVAQTTSIHSNGTRASRLRESVTGMVAHLLVYPAAQVNTDATFTELGADSLFLMRLSGAIEDQFEVAIPFRVLMTELSNIKKLAAHIDVSLPPEAAPVPESTKDALEYKPEANTQAGQRIVNIAEAIAAEPDSTLRDVLTEQLRVMSRQLELLERRQSVSVPATGSQRGVSPAPDRIGAAVAPILPQQAQAATSPLGIKTEMPNPGELESFGPIRPVKVSSASGLSSGQSEALANLIAEFADGTRESKRHAGGYRKFLADPRASTGFQLAWKEMIYPIVAHRSAGSRIWDIDGNEYVDFTMGFGVHLFGHSPDFLIEALKNQMAEGLHIGPQSHLAGPVAQLITEATGMDRVAFCNSGSEAVMAALRLARAAAGRTKVVMFAGSYHGIFDGVLARNRSVEGARKTLPVSPGTPFNMTADMIVLDYGEPESLKFIRQNASSLAAVLVEPIQSRNLNRQPKDFLIALRELTTEYRIALIFDEIISGFRVHPAGAQGWLGIQADLATYGKALSGGIPIGVVAGKPEYLDAVDGGQWSYGDSSVPSVNQVAFAGTFSKNPLAMAAANSVLTALKEHGPQLQNDLNLRTEKLAQGLIRLFQDQDVPIEVSYFSSMFRFERPPEGKWLDLLFYHALQQGIYIWEGRNCFLSTAHTNADIDQFLEAMRNSIRKLRDGGFVPDPPRNDAVRQTARAGSDREATSAIARTGKGEGEITYRQLPTPSALRQLWLHTQINPGASLAYNETFALDVLGPLQQQALDHAVQMMINRHEALRTTCAASGDQIRIASFICVQPTFIDALEDYKASQEGTVSKLLDKETEEPFDLIRGPLFRVRAYRLEESHHLFVLTFHHLIMDGFSFGIFFRELCQFYNAALAKRSYSPKPAAQLSDYVAAQLKNEASPSMASAKAYWLEQIKDAAPLVLSASRAKPHSSEAKGSRETCVIRLTVLDSLKRVASANDCTMFSLLLSAFFILLHRCFGQDDVTVGIPSLARSFHGDETMLGHSIDLLPLRSRIEDSPAFPEYLRRIKTQLLDADQHKVFGYANLTQELSLAGDPQRVPLIRATFNLEPSSGQFSGTTSFAGTKVSIVIPPIRYVKFDLHWNLEETPSGLRLACDYNSHIFRTDSVRSMVQAYAAVLSGIVARPDRQLSEFPLIAESEKIKLLAQWTATSRPYPSAKACSQIFEEQAEQNAAQTAVRFRNETLTYAQLNARSNQLAHYLLELGAQPEERIAIYVERSLEMVVGLLGIEKAGAAYLPLYPGCPEERLKYMLQDAHVSILITQERFRTQLPQGPARIISIDGEWDRIARLSAKNPEARVAGDNLACVIYTSGSTGRPKGVAISHRAVSRMVLNTNYIKLGPGDCVAHLANFSFDATTFELWGALLNGATVILLDREVGLDPKRFARAIQQQNINTVFLITALFNQIVVQLPDAFKNLKTLLFGGEAVDAQIVRHVLANHPPERLLHLYGPAESTTYATWHQVEDASRNVPIGRPIANTTIYILDGAMQITPPGITGQLYIGGDGLARGYLDRPDLTAERFVPNPFATTMGERLYATGDLVRWLEKDGLEFIGRFDDQIKLRGFRIELSEIEAVLREHKDVGQAAVGLREDRPGNKLLIGYVVLRDPSAPLDTEQLNAYLRQRLPEYMVPAAIMSLAEIPLTSNGKLDRDKLPAPDPDLTAGRKYVAPRTQVEETIARTWAQLLGLERVGIHDNFFKLGGDSLRAMRVVAHLRDAMEVDVPISSMFTNPSVAELANIIEELILKSVQELPEEEAERLVL